MGLDYWHQKNKWRKCNKMTWKPLIFPWSMKGLIIKKKIVKKTETLPRKKLDWNQNLLETKAFPFHLPNNDKYKGPLKRQLWLYWALILHLASLEKHKIKHFTQVDTGTLWTSVLKQLTMMVLSSSSMKVSEPKMTLPEQKVSVQATNVRYSPCLFIKSERGWIYTPQDVILLFRCLQLSRQQLPSVLSLRYRWAGSLHCPFIPIWESGQ